MTRAYLLIKLSVLGLVGGVLTAPAFSQAQDLRNDATEATKAQQYSFITTDAEGAGHGQSQPVAAVAADQHWRPVRGDGWAGDLKLEGDQPNVETLIASLDTFEFRLNIVESRHDP